MSIETLHVDVTFDTDEVDAELVKCFLADALSPSALLALYEEHPEWGDKVRTGVLKLRSVVIRPGASRRRCPRVSGGAS